MIACQPSMQAHDELASLFSRNLTFNPELRQQQPAAEQPAHLDPVAAPPATQPIIYSISQHYHHSAHIVKPQPQPVLEPEQPQRPSSEPPQGENLTAEAVLRDHGIDPSGLTPSQIQLFRIADASQQLRLLELWTICPPTKGSEIPALAWSSTTLEQEEHLARMRYERESQSQVMSLDGTPLQAHDGRWQHTEQTEPYMASGYEELMRRESERENRARPSYNHFGSAVGSSYTPATDPVYASPDYVRQQQINMIAQYGAFEQQRMVDAMEM